MTNGIKKERSNQAPDSVVNGVSNEINSAPSDVVYSNSDLQPAETQPSRRQFSLSTAIFLVVSTALLVIIGTLLYQRIILKEDLPHVAGYSMATIVSGSMAPAINVNDVAIIKLNAPYTTGDTVLFFDGTSYVTHRVVGIDDQRVTLRGDANNTNDDPIHRTQVKGKVIFTIPKIGVFSSVILQ